MLRIDIVDDEPVLIKGLVTLLEKSSVLGASPCIRTSMNGMEALQKIVQEPPDILFTDIRMPVMDGLELCERLQEKKLHTQVVIISGYGDFAYAQRCISYGVKEYLLKPVTEEDMEELLRKLLKERAELAESRQLLYAVDQWTDKLEESIWNNRHEEIQQMTDGIVQQLKRSALPAKAAVELLRKITVLLIKKLNERNVYPFREEPGIEAGDLELAVDMFRQSIQDLSFYLVSKRKGQAKDPIEEAKRYIDLHIARESSLEEVAAQLGISPTYFSALFKRETGETFIQYRLQRRMEKAIKLLQDPQWKISDIALEIGYSDTPHFNRIFKKVVGKTPTEYREGLGIL